MMSRFITNDITDITQCNNLIVFCEQFYFIDCQVDYLFIYLFILLFLYFHFVDCSFYNRTKKKTETKKLRFVGKIQTHLLFQRVSRTRDPNDERIAQASEDHACAKQLNLTPLSPNLFLSLPFSLILIIWEIIVQSAFREKGYVCFI